MLKHEAKKGYDGFLFMGDPHVSSRKPHRRRDEDFTGVVCGKIAQGQRIAKTGNLLTVILGDLMDAERDCEPAMLIKLSRALGEWHTPLCLVGNHDVSQSRLTDDTTLALLRETRQVVTIETPGVVGLFDIGGKRVLLGATQHGLPLPESVEDERAEYEADMVVWISHHDLAFGGAYPGALPIEEIRGVDLLVNGHMHLTKPSVSVGRMVAHNPGNITRQGIDALNHEPAVWAWHPGLGQDLERRPLSVEKGGDVFDLTGKIVSAEGMSAKEARQMEDEHNSRFAQMLKSHAEGDFSKSEDAGYLKEDMEALFDDLGTSPEVRAEISGLMLEALASS